MVQPLKRHTFPSEKETFAISFLFRRKDTTSFTNIFDDIVTLTYITNRLSNKANSLKNNKKSFANSKNINKFAVMIATSGLHDSFSRIKKSVCYSSCALERRKFQKMHRIRIIANVCDIVDVTCRLSQLFLRLQRGQVSSTFCIRRGHENSGGAF